MTDISAQPTVQPQEAIAAIARFSSGLAETQWLPHQDIVAMQAQLLERLARHAVDQVPFYRERLKPLFGPMGQFRWEGLKHVTPLTRADIAGQYGALMARKVPWQAGDFYETETSGSTGAPLKIVRCNLQNHAQVCATQRLMDWHGYDYSQTWAGIRVFHTGNTQYPDGERLNAIWGPYWREGQTFGSWHRLSINTPAADQLEWLSRIGRCYLNTNPSNAVALAETVLRNPALRPDILGIFAVGEMVTPDTRDMARRYLGAEILDQYSTQECGCISGQCPGHDHLHVFSEIVLVEALREDGTACAVGEEGLACITVFNSFAMPLIRYQLTDLITMLPPCDCGRGLPVMKVSGGRVRNRFRFSDGTLMAPTFGPKIYRENLGAMRFQCAQVGPETVEIRFVTDWPREALRLDAMRAAIRERLGRPVEVLFKQVDVIPLGRSGKHFDYVNETGA